MPNPVGSDRRIDAALANVSIAFMQDQADALYGQVAPVMAVEKSSGKYYTYPSATWNRRQARRRAPGDPAAEGQFTISNDSFSCELYSVKHKDPREDVVQADDAQDPEVEATEWCAGQVLLEADQLIHDAMMTTSVWDTDISGTTSSPTLGTSILQWDQAASDPITDMIQLGGLIKKKCTKLPNVAVIGRSVWELLVNHPAIIDRVKYTSSDSIRKEIVAKLFELEKIVVPGLTYNSAELGQTASPAFLGDSKDVGLFYVPSSPGKRQVSAAYVFAFNADDYKQGHRVAKWYDQDKNSDMTQVDLYIDVKVTSTAAGAFINGAVA